MNTPKFLRDLLQSHAYADKNSDEFAKANNYLELLFPGQLEQNAYGQYVEPKYDMTYEQFLDAQEKFDNDIEEAIQEAQDDTEDDDIDFSEFVEIEETIDVRVLMPWGDIEDKQLFVYALGTPNKQDTIPEHPKTIWIWRSENDERICEDCASHDSEIFEDKNDIPDIPNHPNCRCWIEEQNLDDNGKPISSKVYKGPKQNQIAESQQIDNNNKQTDVKMDNNDMKFEQAYKQLKTREGGYTTGKEQKKDEPTNIGIKQSTLDRYSAKHPDKNFPQDVKYLTESQAKEIYKTEYWNNTKIPQIENDRIRDAVFDMNVMGGAGKVIQRALNSYTNAGLRVDGVIGTKTITAINAIPTDKVADFMTVVKSERINYLKGTDNWSTSKNGWQTRTNTY